jgi:WD40 repeat protein
MTSNTTTESCPSDGASEEYVDIEKDAKVATEDEPLGKGCTHRILTGHVHNIPAVAFSPSGRLLASCSIDGSCRVWRLKDGQCIQHRTFASTW